MVDTSYFEPLSIAVIIPCLNEAQTIGKVVSDVRSVLPDAQIYVYDNGSTDATVDVAKAAGALVRLEPQKGKGRTLRTAFREIEAQLFVTIDGDDTYAVDQLPTMIQMLHEQRLDMIVGNRLKQKVSHARLGHYWGNQLFSKIISHLFTVEVKDPFSGLRVMTARFVKSFPSVSKGFEVETELTVHAYDLDAGFKEVAVDYRLRPENSHSKLNTVVDGAKILFKVLGLYQLKKPLPFYGVIAAVLIVLSSGLFAVPFFEYLSTGRVAHFPTLIVSMAGFLLAFLSLSIGVVSENNNSNTREIKRFLFRSSTHV